MTNDALRPSPGPTPYAPAEVAADVRAIAGLRPNPVGVAALVSAGVLAIAHVVFQFVTMSTVLGGELLSANVVVVFVQPVVMGLLTVVTVVLGLIGALLRERVRLAAGIGLGVGAYAFVLMLVGYLVGVGYSMA